MDLRSLHMEALNKGGTAIGRALGTVDKVLDETPADVCAQVYKGSFLVLACQAELAPVNSAGYFEVGYGLMSLDPDALPKSAAARLELRYVFGTTLATYPAEQGKDVEAAALLRDTVQHPLFDRLSEFERVRALALASIMIQRSGVSEYGQSLFRQARRVNHDLALHTHAIWLERDTAQPRSGKG